MNYWKPTFKKLIGSLFLGVGLIVVGLYLGASLQSASVMVPFLLPQWLLNEFLGVFFSAHGGSILELIGFVILPQWIYGYILVCLFQWLSGRIVKKNA